MAKMKQLYTAGFDNTTTELIQNAINLLTGDYIWSSDMNAIKPVLLDILKQYDQTSIVLAQILMRG